VPQLFSRFVPFKSGVNQVGIPPRNRIFIFGDDVCAAAKIPSLFPMMPLLTELKLFFT
jgi:hypothetical protein